MKKLKLILCAVLTVVLTASLALAAAETFKTELTGNKEVPPVKTRADGKAVFKLSADSKSLTYTLKVKNIENISAAHIHAGMKGENGPPVVRLFAGPKKAGNFSGELARGTVADQNLIGPLAGKTLIELVTMIKSGRAYVNVHTDKHPGGEIRGHLK